MSRRPWIIPSALLAVISGVVAGWVVVAEYFDVTVFGPRMPDAGVVAHGLREYTYIWSIACLAVGWVRFARKRRPPRVAAIWPVAVVPLAISIVVAVPEAWRAWGEYAGDQAFLLKHGIAHTLPWWFEMSPLIGVTLVLLGGFTMSGLMFLHGRIWRLPVTPGMCTACGYDLTGNVSGTCPECGTRIVEDQSIPAQFYRRKHRWLPELSLFPDARIRYDAWRQANRELHGWWTLWAVVCLAGSVCVLAAGAAGYERAVWAVAGAFVAFATADQWSGRRKMRRALRRQLRSRGLCEKCGGALIGDRCAECGPPTALT